MLISKCTGDDPDSLHVKMTSPTLTILYDNQCRYYKIELLRLRQSLPLVCCLSIMVLQVVVAEVRRQPFLLANLQRYIQSVHSTSQPRLSASIRTHTDK
jgi:hypothetical protein